MKIMKHYTGNFLRHTGLSKHHTHLKFEMGVFSAADFPGRPGGSPAAYDFSLAE
jgi:hypothetical protein